MDTWKASESRNVRQKLSLSKIIEESVSFCYSRCLVLFITHMDAHNLLVILIVFCVSVYKKHYPPALTDEVWRLDKIGKDGAFHKRLQESGIKTVQDFLRSYEMDKQKLRNVMTYLSQVNNLMENKLEQMIRTCLLMMQVLGGGMSNKMWEGTVEHAKTCVLNDKLYVFNADSVHNVLVVFNSIHKLMGVTLSGQYKSVESLTENEKVVYCLIT